MIIKSERTESESREKQNIKMVMGQSYERERKEQKRRESSNLVYKWARGGAGRGTLINGVGIDKTDLGIIATF